ncbi:TrmH family RNA methyltransferase [Haloimpatiens sp. FM7315]|uniref:TrmH family RNA methyltransferase n=1 Tax=Haloimpatiens sp. FM7315 TaxID=3298609 RepID=UPI0039776749
MELDIEQLYREFSNLKLVGSKESSIRIMNDLIKNKKIDDENLFVIEGLWAYEKIIKSNIGIRNFVFCPEFIKNKDMLKMVRLIVSAADDSYLISSNLCSRLSSRDSGEGFFMLCSFPQYKLDDIELKENNLLVILDGLEKPGNIGTIIRSVDGAGGDGVVICNSKVRKTNQKLIKSSMGSSFILPVINSDITEIVMWLKSNGFKIIVTDLKASKSYYNADYKGKIAIIAGNERHGISDIWNEYECECERVIIPMFGVADSLNVGVATTMVVYEASFCQKDLTKKVG